jgi:hypothetical protein
VLTRNDREDSWLVCSSRFTKLIGTSPSVVRQDVRLEFQLQREKEVKNMSELQRKSHSPA